MLIRQATPEDALSIAALSVEVWLSTYVKQGVTRAFADYALSEFTEAREQARLADPQRHSLVSQNAEGLDGVLDLSMNTPAPGGIDSATEITRFYVQPRHHGRGIGHALLRAALDLCPGPVWLTTNAENTPAIRFYLSQGFRQAGTTHFRLGDQSYPNNIYLLNRPSN